MDNIPYAITLRFEGSSIRIAIDKEFIKFIRDKMAENETKDMVVGILRDEQKLEFVILDGDKNAS